MLAAHRISSSTRPSIVTTGFGGFVWVIVASLSFVRGAAANLRVQFRRFIPLPIEGVAGEAVAEGDGFPVSERRDDSVSHSNIAAAGVALSVDVVDVVERNFFMLFLNNRKKGMPATARIAPTTRTSFMDSR
jgi:hypothetical protein